MMISDVWKLNQADAPRTLVRFSTDGGCTTSKLFKLRRSTSKALAGRSWADATPTSSQRLPMSGRSMLDQAVSWCCSMSVGVRCLELSSLY